ncbi:MAG TPA: rhodanese-like domain-containing protein [Ktedonobacterales bacterium]
MSDGSRARRATQFLLQMGYEDVADVAGGTSAWQRAGRPLAHDATATAPSSGG